jgi:redox-sensing transcriptional repressor
MKKVSDSTVGRLSVYLRLLEELDHEGVTALSSEELADHCGTSAAQVRKDLSFFGTFGKRGMGYGVSELIAALRSILGLERRWRVALVGAGKIGAALFAYQDFRRQGFYIESVFDSDISKVGQRWNGLVVRHDAELDDALLRDAVDIVIIAVPAEVAQGVVDRVITAGVKAILNFAPTKLRVPDHVALKNVNMALELEGLSYALANSGGVDRGQQSRAAAARN